MFSIKPISSSRLLTIGLIFTLVLGYLGFKDFDALVIDLDYYVVSARLRFLRIALQSVLALNGLLILLSLWEPVQTSFLKRIDRIREIVSSLRWFNLALAAITLALFLLITRGSYGLYMQPHFARLWVFWLFVLLFGFFLYAWQSGGHPLHYLAAAGIMLGAANTVAAFSAEITTYPLSLGWSETSRFYLASLFFSRPLYGAVYPLSVLHPTRYFLQSLPFIIPGLPLWFHRAWQVFLWLGLSLLTGWLLARRVATGSKKMRWLLAIWAGLFLLQGAVFYHLLVCLAIVFAFFDKHRYWRNLVVVLAASVWGGVSRINWAPMPGLVAACLMYLELPVGQRVLLPWRYFLKSFSYFVFGLLAALGAYWLYVNMLSGVRDPGQFNSAFDSPLLWDRLWPNPSFPLGILTGIALVALPILALILWRISAAPHGWHYLRLLGLGSITAVLLTGGLVVSVKIGGGTNLHNMDAFLSILILVGVYIAFGQNVSEPDSYGSPPILPNWLFAVIVAVPIGFAAVTGGPREPLDHNLAWHVIQTLDQRIANKLSDGGEVLFIAQRHLLTFNVLESQPALVDDYEQIFLMEMVLSGNHAYLDQFYTDLENQRFDVIVTDLLFLNRKVEGRESLAAENNAYLRAIIKPLMCGYYAVETYNEVGVQFYQPRSTPICDIRHAAAADQ